MIKIYKPEIIASSSGVVLKAKIERDGITDFLWYGVSDEYADYLTPETADAFVVGLLWYALKHGNDIHVLCPMSARLYYTLTQYSIPVIAEMHGYKKIVVTCEQLRSEPLVNYGGVGTGLSCGIDSLTTVYEHLNQDIPEPFRITHFTFLQVGSIGEYGGPKANVNFTEKAALAKACAQELGKKLIEVTSNISDFIQLPWGKTHTHRSLSAILALQKLFKTYYYSSESHIKNFSLSKVDPGYYDIFNVSMLSTENTTFFSTGITLNRVERTRMITKFPISYKYLNVCSKKLYNCGKCGKCLVTLLTLEAIGELDKYTSIFDMKAYYEKRDNYIKWIRKRHHSNMMLQEVHDLIL